MQEAYWRTGHALISAQSSFWAT